MAKVNRLTKKMQKLRTLEEGRRQFNALVRPRVTAYVWVNSVSLPVAMTR